MHTSEEDSAKTLALLRSDAAGEVLLAFLAKNKKQEDETYVEGTILSIDRLDERV